MSAGEGPYEWPSCEKCADPRIPCPYWYQNTDGDWVHDPDGSQGYVDEVFYRSPDIGGPPPDTEGKPPKRYRYEVLPDRWEQIVHYFLYRRRIATYSGRQKD